eukprot:CAMPEP_0180262276 /NCGR_PEP_ID=MMETSP0987-20121128/44623_1 /TAXON_ID=697907 /ORGANISM="non described non described, Strain CCMP2293" /LENGTH=30 /DNA_ID= /DNA_START= /DNA_END= /DNA_ORIENTATION=
MPVSKASPDPADGTRSRVTSESPSSGALSR